MTTDQVEKFLKLIFNNKKNQCPILLKSGCFLSFEQRPIICTNAYPCFADRSYWVEKEKVNVFFKKAIDELETIIMREINCKRTFDKPMNKKAETKSQK